MIRFHRILVPVDYSDVSRAAVSAALQVAEHHGAELYLLHTRRGLQRARDDRDHRDADGEPAPHSPEEKTAAHGLAADQQALRDVVDLELARAKSAGRAIEAVPVHTRLSGDDWIEAALRIIEEEKIDLVVSGTLGPRGLKGLLRGSDTEQLVSRAPCSVFVIKPAGPPYSPA